MPYYTWKHKKTGEEKVLFQTISEGDAYEASHKQWERMCGAPLPGDSFRLGVTKADPVLQDRLKEIKKAHKGSTIQTKNLTTI